MWYNYKKTIKEFDVNNFDKLRQHFAENCSKEFPNIFILLKIYLSVPISSAECERSFSSLKRLLNWLRNSMGQERLSDLAVINIEVPSLRYFRF